MRSDLRVVGTGADFNMTLLIEHLCCSCCQQLHLTNIPDADEHSLYGISWAFTQYGSGHYRHYLNTTFAQASVMQGDVNAQSFSAGNYICPVIMTATCSPNIRLTVHVLSCRAHIQDVHKLCMTGAMNRHARASKPTAPGNRVTPGVKLCSKDLWQVNDYPSLQTARLDNIP